MKIFVVDDERIIRVSLADELRDENYEVFEFSNAISALYKLKTEQPNVIITDYKMPDLNGIDFIKKIKEFNENIYVILMTAYSTVDTAVEAMKLGAYDYITKPFDNNKLIITVKHIQELLSLKTENKHLKKKINKHYDFSSYIGNSVQVSDVFNKIKIVADKNTTVLIKGETGTGKELLTNVIHSTSNRADKPLIKVSCAILNREIFESELFGHEKGSFTGADNQKIGRFEMANEGTLYLDDIDDIPLDLQVKLLRALEEKEIERVGGKETINIDIRVIASTKRDLRTLVDEGKFREDLYYRLQTFPIHLPPLRERSTDIKILVEHFVDNFSNSGKIKITKEAFTILKNYPFPGNIRELRNLSERLVLLSQNNIIDESIIPHEIKFHKKRYLFQEIENKSLTHLIEEVERNAIESALEKAGGNKAKAAEILQIPASTLKTKLAKLEKKND